jgi:RNAse (barnase) inhibitor barstar
LPFFLLLAELPDDADDSGHKQYNKDNRKDKEHHGKHHFDGSLHSFFLGLLAAHHAKLRYLDVDLSHADDRATLFAALAKGLALPEHFGNNFDALADSLEDRDWLGKAGCAIRLGHATHYRKTHPHEWSTLEDVLSEASTFWRERNLPFWVLVS